MAGDSATGSCAECGRVFAATELVRIAGQPVCAGCKPVYLQRLQEGGAAPGGPRYAGFWIRLGALVIDYVILWLFDTALIMALTVAMPHLRVLQTGVSEPDQAPAYFGALGFVALLQAVVFATYDTLFVGAYGGTPGKLALRLRVVRPDGSRVGYGRAFGRFLASVLSSLICCIGYLIAAFDPERRTLHDRFADTRVVLP